MKHRTVLIASGFVGAVHSPVYYKQLEYGGETLTKESMKSKGIVTYLCVAFLGAWSFWLAGLARL